MAEELVAHPFVQVTSPPHQHHYEFLAYNYPASHFVVPRKHPWLILSVLETKLQANLELANNLAGPRIILNFSNHFAVESILRPSQPMRFPT